MINKTLDRLYKLENSIIEIKRAEHITEEQKAYIQKELEIFNYAKNNIEEAVKEISDPLNNCVFEEIIESDIVKDANKIREYIESYKDVLFALKSLYENVNFYIQDAEENINGE